MCTDRLIQKFKNIKTSLRTCGNDRPDPLAPVAARFTSGALGNASINDHETDRLFRQIIGGFNVRCRDKLKILSPMFSKAFRHILSLFRLGNPLRGISQQRISALLQRLLKDGRVHLIAMVNHLEQRFQTGTKPLSVGFGLRVAQGGQILDVSNQMGQAELDSDLVIEAHVFAIGTEIITANDALKVLTENIEKHLTPTGFVEDAESDYQDIRDDRNPRGYCVNMPIEIDFFSRPLRCVCRPQCL